MRKSNRVRVDHKKKSDGARVDHEKKNAGGGEFTMRERALG